MFHRMMNYGELEAKPSVAISKDTIRKNLPKFKRHDDLIIIQEQAWKGLKEKLAIPVATVENSPFSIDEDELASLVCQTIQKPVCRRLAIERRVKEDGYRRPDVRLILGGNSIVRHKDNQILYKFDATKCMFSFGNVHEKLRMAVLDCSEEIVVDLFAGIGYFTLPLLVHSKAKHVFACDWNIDAIEALRENLILNKIESDRYTVIHGDNRVTRPINVAQRVLLGILPSCLDYMKIALECVDQTTGAILHCHDLVETKPQERTSSDDRIKLLGSSVAPNQRTNKSDNQTTPTSQSITSSSTSSHSNIEKLLHPLEDLRFQSNENDEDELSLSNRLGNNNNDNDVNGGGMHLNNGGTNGTTYVTKDNTGDDLLQSPADGLGVSDQECDDSCSRKLDIDRATNNAFKKKAAILLERIESDLERLDLTAELIHIEPIKSYAPHVIHVVFDIEVRPKERDKRYTH